MNPSIYIKDGTFNRKFIAWPSTYPFDQRAQISDDQPEKLGWASQRSVRVGKRKAWMEIMAGVTSEAESEFYVWPSTTKDFRVS